MAERIQQRLHNRRTQVPEATPQGQRHSLPLVLPSSEDTQDSPGRETHRLLPWHPSSPSWQMG
eukprot:946136-Ditylum_brightwellii.AAC.1